MYQVRIFGKYRRLNDGWDPETTRTVKGGRERYPFNRTFTVGLNATF